MGVIGDILLGVRLNREHNKLINNRTVSKKATLWLIENKYNYKYKFAKAMKEGNLKYIKSLIKRGKAIPMDVVVDKDCCGNVFRATFKK